MRKHPEAADCLSKRLYTLGYRRQLQYVGFHRAVPFQQYFLIVLITAAGFAGVAYLLFQFTDLLQICRTRIGQNERKVCGQLKRTLYQNHLGFLKVLLYVQPVFR